MRVAVYARVSSPDGKGQSPEMQLRELREHCERRGWQMVGEYVDRMTGTKDSRPELDRLMADAHKRRFDVVIAWKFDRFARSVSHLLRALETFKALGIVRITFKPWPTTYRNSSSVRQQNIKISATGLSVFTL